MPPHAAVTVARDDRISVVTAKETHMRILRAAIGAVVVSVGILVPAGTANGQHIGACPATFTATTLPAFLALPQHQAGLTAGTYDVASLTSLFNAVDGNGDGFVCYRPFPGGSKAAEHVNVVDNHAADD
jgi:hypothetical protein